MLSFSKNLAIIIFKRAILKYPYIIIFSKIYVLKYIKNTSLNLLNLKKYILAHSYIFNSFNLNLNNLILIFFFNKDEILNFLPKHFYKAFSIKYNNFFFNPYCLIKQNYFLFFLSIKNFFFKLKSIFSITSLYLFSILRFLKK